MKWQLILLACLAAPLYCRTSTQRRDPYKNLTQWVNLAFGGGHTSTTSTTTEKPTNDQPENCPPCQCGLTRTRRRIVGGKETKVVEFPWMALLLYNKQFYCGGSLINDLFILTAAHCTAGFRADRISVRLLEHDRNQKNETKTIDRKVTAIIRHPRYNPSTYDNDIALLKLDKRIDLSNALKRRIRSDSGPEGSTEEEDDNGARPVCLASPGHTYKNYKSVVTGWGTTEEGGSVADILQMVNVPIMSNEECRRSAYRNRITDNMMCAGEPGSGRDACQGDSGGPLHIVNATNGQFQEVGIVSWGEGCARPDRPGVYTRVNRYLNWIKDHTQDACVCY